MVVLHTWRSSAFVTDPADAPGRCFRFDLDIDVTSRRVALLAGGVVCGRAALVLEGVLRRLATVKTAIRLEADHVESLSATAAQAVLDAAAARRRDHPLVLDSASHAVRQALAALGVGAAPPLDLTAAQRGGGRLRLAC
jgi:hypothetical protein